MTRVQAREFDQVLLKFDTLTVEVCDARKRVEKVAERISRCCGDESVKKYSGKVFDK